MNFILIAIAMLNGFSCSHFMKVLVFIPQFQK